MRLGTLENGTHLTTGLTSQILFWLKGAEFLLPLFAYITAELARLACMHQNLDVSSVCHVSFLSHASYVFTSAPPDTGTWSSPLLLEQTLAWFWLLLASSPPGTTQADVASARGQSQQAIWMWPPYFGKPNCTGTGWFMPVGISAREWFKKCFIYQYGHSFSSQWLFETHQTKCSLQPSPMTKKSQDDLIAAFQ